MIKELLHEKEYGYFDGALILLGVILANLAAQVTYSFVLSAVTLITKNRELLSNSYAQFGGMAMIQLFYLAVPLLYFGLIKKSRPKFSISVKRKLSPLTIILAVVTPIITIMCFYLPAGWWQMLLEKIGYTINPGVELDTAPKLVVGIILIVFTAPILEEFIFRGFLLNGLVKRFGTLSSCLLSGLAFSLMHMNPEQTIYQFCLGVACAYVAIQSRSIIAPIIMHAVSNLIAVLFQVTRLGDWFNLFIQAATSNWWLSVISTVLLFAIGVVGIFFIGKLIRKIQKPSVDSIPQILSDETLAREKLTNKLSTIIYCAALALCLIMWIFVFGAAMLSGITA